MLSFLFKVCICRFSSLVPWGIMAVIFKHKLQTSFMDWYILSISCYIKLNAWGGWFPIGITRFVYSNTVDWTQCCPKMVAQSPNVTHKWNGQLILVPWVVHFATYEFTTDFSARVWFGKILQSLERWQAAWQHWCQAACQISKRLEN